MRVPKSEGGTIKQPPRTEHNRLRPAFRSFYHPMCDGSSSAMQHKGMKWVWRLFVLLVCLIEIQYMIIDYRLKANLQLLESAVHQMSLLDFGSLPKTSPHLQIDMMVPSVRNN
jgi:hypothetical protein